MNNPVYIYIYMGLLIFLDFDHCLKFVPLEAIKACRGRRDTAPHILNLGTRWRREQTVTPRPLYLQGQNPHYPSNRRTAGLQSRSGDFADRKQKAFRKLGLVPSSGETVDRPPTHVSKTERALIVCLWTTFCHFNHICACA